MLKFRTLFAITGLLLAFVAGSASAQLKEGRDYDLISSPQPTEKGKIEVIEFFSYLCPHCDRFDPTLAKWAKTLAKDVILHKIPVVFRPQWEATAKLYYTLEAMGELDKLHSAAFSAVHRENIDMTNDKSVADWAVKKGLDRKKFTDTFNSFAVQSKAAGSKQKQGAYGIQAVPMLVVAGKYRTPDDFHGGFDELLKVVDNLIVKVRAEQFKK